MLKKQLFIIISILFIVIFATTLMITSKSTQAYLNSAMKSQVVNTAHALGISISQHASDDTESVKLLIDSFFKTGGYHTITYSAPQQNILLERKSQIISPKVPSWLMTLLPLQQQVGEDRVTHGWAQAGNITVTSQTHLAYEKLWSDIIKLFWGLLIIAIATMAFSAFALRRLLTPLNEIQRQATAICAQDFSVTNTLPKTKELAIMVTSLNQACHKTGEVFDEQNRLIETLRSQAYHDHLTGLRNRRFYSMQIENYLQSRDEFTTGSLYLIQIKHVSEYKKNYGYEAAQLYIKRFSEVLTAISGNKHCFSVYRLSDKEFALLAANIDSQKTKEIASKINSALDQLHANIATTIVKHHMGIAYYKTGQSANEFLAEADMALRTAQSKAQSGWYMYDVEDLKKAPIIGASGWQEKLDDVIKTNNIIFHYQPVKNVHNKTLLHHEILLRIPDQENDLIHAGLFIPMAENLNKIICLDKLVITKTIHKLNQKDQDPEKYAVNLSPKSIHDKPFVDWLFEIIEEHPLAAKRLILELPEQVALDEAQSLSSIIDRLHRLGAEFSLDHFGRGFTSFKCLKGLHVDYIKIDGSYIRHINQDLENQFFVQTITEIAHNLGIKTIAGHVETQEEVETLKNINIDGIQGYYLGEPKENIVHS